MIVQQTGLFCMRQLSSAERLQGAPIGGSRTLADRRS
jgi:hypothetical protein